MINPTESACPGVVHGENGRDSYVSHLLSQIEFLHAELERLEKQLAGVRQKAHLDAKDNCQHLEQQLAQKNAELQEWRSKLTSKNNDVDFKKRCSALEKQIALMNSEKSVLSLEKSEMCSKVRRLEAALKSRKAELHDLTRRSNEESTAAENRVAQLLLSLKEVSEERDGLQSRVNCLGSKNPEVVDVFTEMSIMCVAVATETVNPPTHDQCSQADSVIHFAEPGSQAHHSLSHALHEKTQDYETLRCQLDDVQHKHEETVRILENTTKRLSEEIERRKLICADAERLSVQVRSLQQKCSTQTAVERDLVAKIDYVEEQRQQLRAELTHLEHERNSWEGQIQHYEKDMEQLTANKNYSNQQLSLLANENENLRAEVQRLLTRESQMAFTLKAKDGELQEVLQAYRNSTAESSAVLENQRFLERELDNVRATYASKEEGIIFLQEQLSTLHQREQQLVLDIQTFEYENDQLHRRIVNNDAHITQLESKCQELQYAAHTKDLSIEEIHQSLAELSKQVVIKENEVLLLRRRCDCLEAELSHSQAAVENEAQKNRSLEEANARLVARDVLASGASYETVLLQLKEANAKITSQKGDHEEVKRKLVHEETLREAVEKELKECKAKLLATVESKERLECLVMDQTRALSSLSK